MSSRSLLPLLAIATLILLPSASAAQVRPSPAEAQALLQSRPELVAQLRQRIVTSGMTTEQIRARLRAEGYPENLLDAYLPGSTAAAAPTDSILSAIGKLGIADANDVGLMRTMLGGPTPQAAPVRDDRPAQDQEDADVVFGLSLFRSSTSEFVPMLDGPVDATYRLGPGDQLVLILTGEVELAHTLDVTREGFIVIPQVGQLGVANLTLAQLEDLLYTRLGRSYSGIRRGADAPTRFSVSVSRLRAIQVYVTGEVARPGSYRISSAATAMTALYAAGGPTESGSLREVTVRRGQTVRASLDVYDYLLRGDNSRDVRLENGDILFVRTHGPRVRVLGEVLRPATYELKPTETIRDAIALAGGFRATAQTHRVQIQRIVRPEERVPGGRDRTLIDVQNAGARAEDLPAIAVAAGDELRVFAVTAKVRNLVTVNGHVWSPGRQAIGPGTMVSEVLRTAGGLRPDAYLGLAHISRLRSDNTREMLRVTLRDTTGAVVNDIAVMEDDEISVYSVSEFRPDRYVAIGGAVKTGGRFEWREGMTLRDLVILGGGLREGASLREVEIARLPADRTGGITAVTQRVPLDSTYLVEYDPRRPYQGAPGENAAGRGAAEFLLDPYDNVLVLEQPDWQLQRTVVLSGEVRYPGRYALVRKGERISDIIRRAGGLTREADPNAAFFSRTRVATAFVAEEAGSSARTRVGIDLSRALRRPAGDDDLILLEGDEIHIPFSRTTVEIRGNVNSANAVTIEPGKSIAHYIRSAGGASATGDARNAYVIQPNGKIESRRRLLWIIRLDPTPRAGSTVVVPAAEERGSSSDRIATVALIAQTIASIAAVAALLR